MLPGKGIEREQDFGAERRRKGKKELRVEIRRQLYPLEKLQHVILSLAATGQEFSVELQYYRRTIEITSIRHRTRKKGIKALTFFQGSQDLSFQLGSLA